MNIIPNITIEEFKRINSRKFMRNFLEYPYELLCHQDIQNLTRRFVFDKINHDMRLSRDGYFNHYYSLDIIMKWCDFFLYLRDNHPDQYRPIFKNMVWEMSTRTPFLDLFGLVALRMKIYHPSDDFPFPDDMFNKTFSIYNDTKDVEHLQSILEKEQQDSINIVLLLKSPDEHFELLSFVSMQNGWKHVDFEEAELFF